MLIQPDQNINVSVWYHIGEDKSLFVTRDPSRLPPFRQSILTKLTCKMKLLSWRRSNELLRSSRNLNPSTMTNDIDWQAYREKRLVYLLSSWDLSDGQQSVALTPENVLLLAPALAGAILAKYDEQTGSSE